MQTCSCDYFRVPFTIHIIQRHHYLQNSTQLNDYIYQPDILLIKMNPKNKRF